MKYIGWFSCGATSSVACKIAIDEGLDIDLWYLYTGAEHSDNERFISDCEKWYGKKIKIARSNKFSCPEDEKNYLTHLMAHPVLSILRKKFAKSRLCRCMKDKGYVIYLVLNTHNTK